MPAPFKKQILNLVLIVSVLCFIPLRQVRTSAMPSLSGFPGSEAAFYQQFNSLFNAEADQDIIFIALGNSDGIFNKSFLQKTAELTRYISSLQQVRRVYSVTNSNIIYFTGNQVGARPLVNIWRPETYAADSVYLFQSPEYRDLLVSGDGKHIAVAVFYKPGIPQGQSFALLKNIEEKTASLRFDGSYIASPLRAQKDFLNSGLREFTAFALACVVLLVGSSIIILKSIRPGLAMVVLTLLSLLWTAAAMALMNLPAQPIHIFLPLVLVVASMIQVLGVARMNPWQKAGAYKTIFLLVAAMIAACLPLCFSAWPPTRQFGLTSAVGVAISGLLSAALLPFLLPTGMYSRRYFFTDVNSFGSSRRPLFARNLIVFFWLIILSAACVVFYTPLKSLWWNDHVPVHSSTQKSLAFVDDQFSGFLPFELSVEVRHPFHSFYERSVMEQMEQMEAYLEDSCGVGAVISPLSFFRAANKAFSGGEVVYYRLPEQQNVQQLYGAIMQTEHADEMNRYLNEAGTIARISGRVHFAAGTDYGIIAAKLKAWLHRTQLDQVFLCRLTGPLVVAADSVKYSLQDTWRTLFMIMFIALGFQLLSSRSLDNVFIAIAAALLPVLVMLAAIALLHLPLSGYVPVLCVVLSFVSGSGAWLNDAASPAHAYSATRLPGISLSLMPLPVISLLLLSNFPVLKNAGIALIFGIEAAMLIQMLLLFTTIIRSVENSSYKTEVNQPPV